MLAAGAGSRLSGEGQEALPKPLVPLAGRPLLEHVLKRLAVIGPRRILIVLGHGHRRIERFLKGLDPAPEVIPVFNPAPERENGYSLLQAEGLVEGQFLTVMADHLVDPAIYRAAAGHRGLGLCVDFAPPSYLVAEATKVLVKDGQILRIGKELEEWNGLDTGVFSLTPLAFRALRQLEGRPELTLSEMVRELVRMGEP
ncbi:MAG: NTP transferase domain-containing protein, partial [Candidatus Bipolaricaulia bacterium]